MVKLNELIIGITILYFVFRKKPDVIKVAESVDIVEELSENKMLAAYGLEPGAHTSDFDFGQPIAIEKFGNILAAGTRVRNDAGEIGIVLQKSAWGYDVQLSDGTIKGFGVWETSII